MFIVKHAAEMAGVENFRQGRNKTKLMNEGRPVPFGETKKKVNNAESVKSLFAALI